MVEVEDAQKGVMVYICSITVADDTTGTLSKSIVQS